MPGHATVLPFLWSGDGDEPLDGAVPVPARGPDPGQPAADRRGGAPHEDRLPRLQPRRHGRHLPVRDQPGQRPGRAPRRAAGQRHPQRGHPALLDRPAGAPSTGSPTCAPASTTTRRHAASTRARRSWCPPRWDAQFTALCDVALERHLPDLDPDVLVTVTPGLLAAAEQLVGDRVVLVHQEHRSSSDRVSGLEPLLTYGPRADVLALLTESRRRLAARRARRRGPARRGDAQPAPPGLRPPLAARRAGHRGGRPAGGREAARPPGPGVRLDRAPGPRLAAADLRRRPRPQPAAVAEPQGRSLRPGRGPRRLRRHAR